MSGSPGGPPPPPPSRGVRFAMIAFGVIVVLYVVTIVVGVSGGS